VSAPAPLDPAWVAVIAPGGPSDKELVRVGAWSDAQLLEALGAHLDCERREVAAWLEALRRGLPLPPVAGFSEKLAEWPERSLMDALGPFVQDYDLPRRAALLLEAARRGLRPGVPTTKRPPACLVMATILGLTFALIFIQLFRVVLTAESGGDPRVAAAAFLGAAIVMWAVGRYVRPWLRKATDEG
jgi:hypothetical protein